MTQHNLAVVLTACTCRPVTGYSGSFAPGDLVPARLINETGELYGIRKHTADFGEWWGGELAEPVRSDGRLYPRLLIRPADGSVWLQELPRKLRLLKDCDRKLALLAVRRCHDEEILRAAIDWCGDVIVRRTITASLQGSISDTTPVALELSNLNLTVVQADGEELSLARCYADELDPALVTTCEDREVLERLIAQQHEWTPLAIRRLDELKRPAPATEPTTPQPGNPSVDNAGQAAGTDTVTVADPLPLPTPEELLSNQNAEQVAQFVADVSDAAWLQDLLSAEEARRAPKPARVTVSRAIRERLATLELGPALDLTEGA